jgi:hypothetical protein
MTKLPYISVAEYLMGRVGSLSDLTPEQVGNLNTLIPKVNMFLEAFGSHRKVNSGYRSPAINAATPGAAPKSNHLICAAVDLEDADAKLHAFARNNTLLLEDLGLWCEERQGGWLHLQIYPPRSGKRFFKP